MTFVRAVEIACDGPDNGTPCPEYATWTSAGNARSLRRTMAQAGWHITKNADRCPRCRKDTK